MTEIIETIKNEADGLTVFVARIDKGYSVAIRDDDAEEFVPLVQIFKNLELALEFARTC